MKKILALLLTVGMVLGLFAGCGNSNTTPAGTAAAANPTAAAAADSLDGPMTSPSGSPRWPV